MSGWYLELSKLFLEAVYCTNQFCFPLCYTMFDRLLPDMFSLKWCLHHLNSNYLWHKTGFWSCMLRFKFCPIHNLPVTWEDWHSFLVWQLETTTEVHNSIMMIKWGRPCKDFCIVLTHTAHLINISIYYYFIILQLFFLGSL